MNRSNYLVFHEAMCKEALALSKRKNHDYSGGEDGRNPFQNFMFVEQLGMEVSTEQGFMVRLADKFKRLGGFIKTGSFQVSDESFRDTCLDVINYICLMAAYVESKEHLNGNKAQGAPSPESGTSCCQDLAEDDCRVQQEKSSGSTCRVHSESDRGEGTRQFATWIV